MVLLLRKTETKQSAVSNLMDNKEDASSSDEGNSAFVSDGDRSRISSPPSATDMSFVVDEGTSTSQLPPIETRRESSYNLLLPHDQLMALAEMRPPPEIPVRRRSATLDSYSMDNENLILKETRLKNDDDDESPLSYKSLEERSTSIAKNLMKDNSNESDQATHIPYHTIYDLETRQMLDSKKGSLEPEEVSQKLISLKNTPKIVSTKSKQGTALRRGKWTVEEEAYVARVIQDFNSGYLDAPAGTTLRTYLSEKLKCDPMRITKKFTGDACIGKRVFHPAVRNAGNSTTIDTAQAELETLERRWRRRLELQQRESAKKAAASVAVAAAATSGSNDLDQPNAVAQTASWLDRAKLALQDPSIKNSEETTLLHQQMQEVQRLIYEGPVIQQTSADLPQILDEESHVAHSQGVEEEPADKRLRTDEDAEALVGFIRSVRASAASGEEF